MFKKSLVLAVLLLIIGFIFWLLLMFRTPEGKPVNLQIKSGLSGNKVAALLAKKRIISSPLLFTLFAKFDGVDGKILPGSYLFNEGMSTSDALKVLARGPKRKLFKITIPEGFTIDEIGQRLETKTFLNKKEFIELAKNGKNVFPKHPFLKDIPTSSLEGYLFPKTFVFDSNATPSKFIEIMLEQFGKESSSLDLTLARQKNLSLHQVVTIASLIEKEAKVAEERPLVAAVVYNRLAIGMPLKIDATIQYALPERKVRLTKEDLKIESPYNTYVNKGLPPGPIANPGSDSLKAALNPAPVDYLYYVLTDPASGRHSFTRDYQEFLKFKRQGKKAIGN